jgi:hypothetical protein
VTVVASAEEAWASAQGLAGMAVFIGVIVRRRNHAAIRDGIEAMQSRRAGVISRPQPIRSSTPRVHSQPLRVQQPLVDERGRHAGRSVREDVRPGASMRFPAPGRYRRIGQAQVNWPEMSDRSIAPLRIAGFAPVSQRLAARLSPATQTRGLQRHSTMPDDRRHCPAIGASVFRYEQKSVYSETKPITASSLYHKFNIASAGWNGR